MHPTPHFHHTPKVLQRTAAVVACVLFGSCVGDRVPSLDRIGATRSADGAEIAILFDACPGEVVERVEVLRSSADFDETSTVLWAIEAERGSTLRAFAVGTVPDGFEEVQSLRAPLRSDGAVQALVTSSRNGTIPLSFRVSDLRAGEVLVRSDMYRSPAEFARDSEEGC